VTVQGNFEGRNILNVTRTVDQVAKQLGIPPEELEASLQSARHKLYEARQDRPPPLRDNKILTSWNGLMISAMARAGFVLGEAEWTERASRAAGFLLEHVRKDGRLLRTSMDGKARHNGYLEDYAFLIAGLLDLYEATSDLNWGREALALQATLDRHHWDSAGGGYFRTSDDHEVLLAREKPKRDGAQPAGNSVALMNLLRLHELTTDDSYREKADTTLRTFSATIRGSSEMMLALDFKYGKPKEIVIVTPRTRGDADAFLDVLRTGFWPNRVLVVASEGRNLAAQTELFPLLKGKVARDGKPTAYVCERGVCQLPTSAVDVFEKQLAVAPPAG
jgi:uncharacterized protein YyaL (SSP411 family)